MYDNHVPLISHAMRSDFVTFQRGLAFVVCSIRQQIISVPDQIDMLFSPTDYHGEEREHPLFGHKWNAWEFICDLPKCRALWERVRHSDNAFLVVLDISRSITGLGVVKAAFVAQLMGHDVACLDSRNVKREGRNPRAYRSDGKKDGRAWERKVLRYISDTSGRAREYWNAWCEDVATRYDLTANDVSALHLAIVPDSFTR